MSPSRQAGAWLLDNRAALADSITEAHFQQRPELEQRYGPKGRVRCREDNEHHLGYLAQAVSAEQPALFENYIVWARVLLDNLHVPASDLAHNLELLHTTIEQAAPAEHRQACLAPLADVIARFDTLPTTVQTHLQPDQPHSALARRYLDLLLSAKRRDASQLVLDAVADGVPVRDIYLHVFQPAQYEVGRLWQMNEVSVAQEHFCTAATQMIMSQLYGHLFGTERNGFQLVTACVSGDLHEIGARILTDLFEMAGWDTFYIGANTPTASIVQTVREEGADLVALSATMVAHVPLIEEAIRGLRAEFPDLPIMVGGYPFLQAPELVQAVGADATAVDADQATRVGMALVTGTAS